MTITYYAKLTIFLLLAAVGGLLGAIVGAVASFFLAPFLVSMLALVSYSTTFPFSVAIFVGYCAMISCFIWSFLKSYTILVRTFW